MFAARLPALGPGVVWVGWNDASSASAISKQLLKTGAALFCLFLVFHWSETAPQLWFGGYGAYLDVNVTVCTPFVQK
jgi:hypothetical protein